MLKYFQSLPPMISIGAHHDSTSLVFYWLPYIVLLFWKNHHHLFFENNDRWPSQTKSSNEANLTFSFSSSQSIWSFWYRPYRIRPNSSRINWCTKMMMEILTTQLLVILVNTVGFKSYIVSYYLPSRSLRALRGHGRLPDAFNEGNAIIVSSSTSVCFLLFLWIYGSSINTNETFSVISIVVSIDLIILLVCFYAGRVYIMLLDPKRNTKAFVKTYTRKRGFLFGKAITPRSDVHELSW